MPLKKPSAAEYNKAMNKNLKKEFKGTKDSLPSIVSKGGQKKVAAAKAKTEKQVGYSEQQVMKQRAAERAKKEKIAKASTVQAKSKAMVKKAIGKK